MTAEALKAFIQTPLMLFVLMLAASLCSAFKEIYTSTAMGADRMKLSTYLAHWPETLMTLASNVAAFLALVMTDTLNFGSAIGIGWMANSVSGMIGQVMPATAANRSVNLVSNSAQPPSPPKE